MPNNPQLQRRGAAIKYPRYYTPEETWQPTYLRQIELLAMLGHPPTQIALVLGVRPKVFEKWVRERFDVQMALARGIPKAESELVDALMLTGCGYSHSETKIVTYEGKVTDTIEMTKHYPPNVEAAKVLLKRLRPEAWSDKDGLNVSIDNRSITINSTDPAEAAKEYMKLVGGG